MSLNFKVKDLKKGRGLQNGKRVKQIAAACLRTSSKGREILMITSSNGRWILPKGWPIDGKSDAETAQQEAWEEAGVRKGEPSEEPIGTYDGTKRFDNGIEIPCRTEIYKIDVTDSTKKFPEANDRSRKWMSIGRARKLVDEPGLRKFLKSLPQ